MKKPTIYEALRDKLGTNQREGNEENELKHRLSAIPTEFSNLAV